MHRNSRWLALLLGPLCAACGGTAATQPDGGGTGGNGTGGHGTGGMIMAGGIPDPGAGDMADQNFTSVEPNETPAQATPLGTAMAGDLNVWVNNNNLGAAGNTSDYFVFKSGPAAGNFTFDICFTAPITDMTATLSKVVNGTAQTPPLGTWKSASTCVTNMGMATPTEASTDYLFGLTAVGGAGTYSA